MELEISVCAGGSLVKTTVMLRCIHVDATTGNLVYNAPLICSNGVYGGPFM